MLAYRPLVCFLARDWQVIIMSPQQSTNRILIGRILDYYAYLRFMT